MRALPYRGRFAPSPSGPLHFGSLVAALGSYLDARVRGGAWLVRMEDLDPSRVVPGAADRILRSLEACGFQWEGSVMYQSRRGEAYQAALEELQGSGQVYRCACSRKGIADQAMRGADGPVYPGICRSRPPEQGPAAQRFRAPELRLGFEDAQQGRVVCDLAAECGDFVLRRADGVFSYQLAVVVDDAAQGITHVVRGADLLTSTPRQIVLQQALGLPTPAYRHLPVVLDEHGDKLSKQTLATPLDDQDPLPALLAAWAFLGGSPAAAGIGSLPEFWEWAPQAWRVAVARAIRGRRVPALP